MEYVDCCLKSDCCQECGYSCSAGKLVGSEVSEFDQISRCFGEGGKEDKNAHKEGCHVIAGVGDLAKMLEVLAVVVPNSPLAAEVVRFDKCWVRLVEEIRD